MPTGAVRWVLHADMDAFFASVEQRDRPALRGRPVIVGGTGPRGVVSAASYEARRFGVRSAMPGFRARALCPEGVFLDGDLRRYAAVSARIREVFGEFTSQVEPIALDEAFLDITGSLGLFGGPRALAEALKRRVWEETALKVSVGVGPNKLIAKIACTLSKPDGLKLVTPDEVPALLAPLPVRRLWGVGPTVEAALARLGIHTIGQLVAYDPAWLTRLFGERRAASMMALARGEDHRPVEADQAAKSYGEENTFDADVSAREVISAALTGHAEAIAARLRRGGVRGRTITLRCKLATPRGERSSRTESGAEPVYPLVSRSRTLNEGTDDDALIRRVALALWDELALTEPVRLIGISVSKLERATGEQLELFRLRARRVQAPSPLGAAREASSVELTSMESVRLADVPSLEAPSDTRRQRLGGALDAIRERYGEAAISRAVRQVSKASGTSRIKAGSLTESGSAIDPYASESRRARPTEGGPAPGRVVVLDSEDRETDDESP
ncbi:MAG: DNA polymerase IV [Polyangiaceae bacterium]|nr:DNA polymerase IV [Polyangiaceae bacterium]MCW5791298.1 DNA polymerase IV [Polyangiaceae bacterium]